MPTPILYAIVRVKPNSNEVSSEYRLQLLSHDIIGLAIAENEELTHIRFLSNHIRFLG